MLKSIFLGLCSALLIALSFARVTHAADVVMISHPGTTISAREVKEVFLGSKQFAGTIKLIPVDNAALQRLGVLEAKGRELMAGCVVFPLVNAANDQPTADVLTQRLDVHEKTAWMLRSLLED